MRKILFGWLALPLLACCTLSAEISSPQQAAAATPTHVYLPLVTRQRAGNGPEIAGCPLLPADNISRP